MNPSDRQRIEGGGQRDPTIPTVLIIQTKVIKHGLSVCITTKVTDTNSYNDKAWSFGADDDENDKIIRSIESYD